MIFKPRSEPMPTRSSDFEPKPESPCVRICTIDADGYCQGCYRTLQEISAWPRMSGAEQRQVLAEVRRRSLTRRRPRGCDFSRLTGDKQR
jgi:predicted Fe-S protein YdhL (DUF1289 family)